LKNYGPIPTLDWGQRGELFPVKVNVNVAEQSHCSLHVKELKVTKTELKRQIGE